MKRTVTTLLTLGMAISVGAQITMNVDASKRGPMLSPYQYGLFFEEINHAGEGGLYAELVKNRSFSDQLQGWTALNETIMNLSTSNLLNSVQTAALHLNTNGATNARPKGVINSGYWGMNIQKDSTYTLSFWAKGAPKYNHNIKAQLLAANGTVIGEATVQGTVTTASWSRLTATLKATGTDNDGHLALLTGVGGHLYIDEVSLFPYTWKGRKNGLRSDLAQLLADTHPSFLRFPGGCYVEGEGSYDNAFQWKKTIGPIEQRPGHLNQNWGYFSTDGLGFDEYLQLCEDLGAAPMFVVNVGLGHGYTLSLEATKALVQDALDAIEYANGDASTEWGAKRVANGHAEPYHLKMIEVGNENYQNVVSGQQSDQYAERYKMFYDAIKAKYPDIVVIGNVEAWGTDNPSWRNDYPVEMVDEHYYRTAEWMRNNYNKYDNYSRSIGVYNGEYAANGGNYGRYGHLGSALGEAIYMLGMERNSDVCRMASFAPIFTHEKDPRWAYDMIHFNASSYFVTPSYYVQQLMASHLGTQNLLWTENGNQDCEVNSVQVGVGSWLTTVAYDDAELTSANGTVLATDAFDTTGAWTPNVGNWEVENGMLVQKSTEQNCTAVLNLPVSGNYTYKVRAKKTGGREGFLIVFNRKDANNYLWWNIGGWGNTQHAVEQCVNGNKTTVASTAGHIENDRWYQIEVRVKDGHVICLLDGQKIHDFDLPSTRKVYQSVQIDENKHELLVKLVNAGGIAQQVTLNLTGMKVADGKVSRLASTSATDENTMEAPMLVTPTEGSVSVSNAQQLKLEVPAYSLNIYRLPVSDVSAAEPEIQFAEYEQEDADKVAYLFAHMNSGREITNYALSKYGKTWTDLLGGAEVFDTKAHTVTGGMRDAYICRMENGGFMLAGTDMTARLGWTSNHIMELMYSPDLVHWTKNVKIDLETPENLQALGGITAEQMSAAWAPQVIYDKASGKYVVYYSVGFPDRHRIYYQLVDKNLNVLTRPRLYFDPGYDIIDADIVWNAAEQRYVMIYKCEKTNGFDRATATHLVPQAGEDTGVCQWTVTKGFHVSDKNQAIEAPTQWRPIGSKRWNLSFINYGGDRGYKTIPMDEHAMKLGSAINISGQVAAQHGSILKLTAAEYDYLKSWEQVKILLPQAEIYYENSKNTAIGDAVQQAQKALSESMTVEANQHSMKAAENDLRQCVGTYLNYLRSEAAQGRPADLTMLLTNADFSEGSKGWNCRPTFTAANGQVAEYFNTNFDFSQTVTGLPKGKYEVSVQSFYREGSIETALATHDNDSEKHYASFYANGQTTPIMSLYDDAVTHYNVSPYSYPNNVGEAQVAFNRYGLYTNTIQLTLPTSGNITLGIRKNKGVADDWCCFDNFRLKYLGDPTGISHIGVAVKDRVTGCYNLQGQRVEPTSMQRGIYIVNGKKIIQ